MKDKDNKHRCTSADIKKAIHNIEKQPKREINSDVCNILEMERQQKTLIQAISQKITETENHNTFDVYDNEASFGKTTIALNALPYFLKNNPSSRGLWIGEETDKIDENVEYLNSLFEKEIAIAIHNKNNMSNEQKIKALEEYVFVFITHERYRRLSLNLEEKEIYTKDRDLLIIDEYVDMTKKVDLENDILVGKKDKDTKSYIIFDRNRYIYLKDQTERLFGAKSAVMKYFKEITRTLKFFVERYDCKPPILMKATKMNSETLETILDNFNKWIDFPRPIRTLDNKRKIKYENYKQSIIELKNFYLGYFLIENDKDTKERTLKVPSYYMDMWGLKRNIILDASAELCYEYKLNPTMYHIKKQPKIFDYKKWYVLWINVNTTQHGKTRYKNFYEKINEVIAKLGADKTLIVTTKYNDIEPINKNDPNSELRKKNVFIGNVTHWEDFKGKNDHEDLRHIIIEDSNWLWSSEYILKYLYYARNCENIIQNIKYIMVQKKFENELLQEIAESITANNYYQAVKRINRSMKYESRVYILCSNKNIVDKVVNMLPNCDYRFVEDTDNVFLKKKSNKKPKQKKNINCCIELCNEILEKRNNYKRNDYNCSRKRKISKKE